MDKEELVNFMKETKEENEKSFKNFLENKALYSSTDFYLAEVLEQFKFLPLQLFCPECQGERTYSYNEEKSDIKYVPGRKSFTTSDQLKYFQANGVSRRETLNKFVNGKTYHFLYDCQSCNEHQYNFLVTFSYGKIHKSGQEPSFGINIEKGISKKLGDELAKHYKNGKICELHGLGIAAMAYYRRVVEDKIYSLLEEIATFVEESRKTDYLNVVEKVRSSHKFEEKADLLKDVMPPVLTSPEGNYVKLLFSKVSEGLHSKSDEECLKSAHDISLLLESIIHIINTQANAQKSLAEISKRLKN